jgi:hypothetical protein
VIGGILSKLVAAAAAALAVTAPEPSHCPSGHPACRETVGRIVYVERVDPDGDGDAHFVIRDPQEITLPGLTAIDVRKGLRPHPLPTANSRARATRRVCEMTDSTVPSAALPNP